MLPAASLERLQREPEQFEQQTFNQIAVAIYPQAPQSAIEEFTIHVAERSRLGRKELDNGAILFLFVVERSARLEVGYGQEGVLTDVETHCILAARLAPAFACGAYMSKHRCDDAGGDSGERAQCLFNAPYQPKS